MIEKSECCMPDIYVIVGILCFLIFGIIELKRTNFYFSLVLLLFAFCFIGLLFCRVKPKFEESKSKLKKSSTKFDENEGFGSPRMVKMN